MDVLGLQDKMIKVVRRFRPSCDPRDIFPIKQAKSLETLSLTEN